MFLTCVCMQQFGWNILFKLLFSCCSKFAVRYKQLHGGVDDNAFWPGHLLDKLRLCMPPYDKPTLEPGSRALFQQTRGEIPVNQGYASLDTWQANDGGYIQQGTYDPYFNKSIV